MNTCLLRVRAKGAGCCRPVQRPYVSYNPPHVATRSKPCCATVPSTTPSNKTSASQLEMLQRHSVILSDSVVTSMDDSRASTAVVNLGLIADTLATSAMCEFSNAIDKAVTLANHEGRSMDDAIDYALVNLGVLLKNKVLGRVITEVDPRVTNDADATIARARRLVEGYEAQGVGRDSLLIAIPATWAGLQAVKSLEAEGISCQVIDIYSLTQAVAAIQAHASIIVPNVSRINTWYAKHPGAIRDSKGPRQDAGGDDSGINVGVRLAKAMYDYTRQFGAGTRIVMTGIRTIDEALQLSGADYLIIPETIQAKLKSATTLQGYNDGFTAVTSSDDDDEFSPALTSHDASRHVFTRDELGELTDEEQFNEKLGMAGRDLLESQIDAASKNADRISELLGNFATSRE